MASDEMAVTKRRYELRKRAEHVEETRRRITEATMELHRTIGPARTSIAEVARRAGVERVTVYSHFPDNASLFAACSAHWRALHPSPDTAAWSAIGNPRARVRRGLEELYRWYRETEPMTANVLRDAQILPALQTVVERGAGAYRREVRRLLTEPFGARGRRREALEAAIDAVPEFHFWRALSKLGDDAAADLGTALVAAAAR